ncbi:MAG: hypothetical protein ACK559_20440, partial [bacterium]
IRSNDIKNNKFRVELVPENVNDEPTIAEVARCGFSIDMTNKAFNVLLKMKEFESFLYQLILTLPYCYPLRAHHLDVNNKYNKENRYTVLSTIILGMMWNNPKCIPILTDKIVQSV